MYMFQAVSATKRSVDAGAYVSKISTSNTVDVRVNDASAKLSGTSIGLPNKGKVTLDLRADRAFPKGFSSGLLAAFVESGKGDQALPVDGAHNPFQRVGGVCTMARTLNLGDRGMLRSDSEISPMENGRRKAHYTVSGWSDVHETVRGVATTVEKWTSAGAGVIRGTFSIQFLTDEGPIDGMVETIYKLPADFYLEEPLCRKIVFGIRAGERDFHLSEDITLAKKEEALA